MLFSLLHEEKVIIMALQEPESMDDCLYFTNRIIGNGKAQAWVLRKECPQCHKDRMGKPANEKTGKVMKKAENYVCKGCGYSEEALHHEKGLMMSVIYTCPGCGFSGEATTEYRRRSFEGVQAYVFDCGKCKKSIGITKKLKETKKKGSVKEADDDEV